MRQLCEICQKNNQAINYKKQGKTYYRKFCNSCILEHRKKSVPQWQKQGYKKKIKCESCGFLAKHEDQLSVNEYRDSWVTICLNCSALVKVTKKLSKKSDLKSDF